MRTAVMTDTNSGITKSIAEKLGIEISPVLRDLITVIFYY